MTEYSLYSVSSIYYYTSSLILDPISVRKDLTFGRGVSYSRLRWVLPDGETVSKNNVT